MTKIAEPKTPGGIPKVRCNLCHQERVANASRQNGHLLHLKEGWEGCKGVPPPPRWPAAQLRGAGGGSAEDDDEDDDEEGEREQGEDMEESGSE